MNIPTWAETIAVAAAIAGATPIISALIIQWNWPSSVKTVVGLVLAFAAALAGQAVLLPDWPGSAAEWITFIVAVIAGTQLAYHLLWKPAGVEKVELATTSKSGRAPRHSTV
jgi:hypothetical protein